MNDKFARVLTGLAVLAVAVIAAIVSFSHIESLALAHGQPAMAARLLPLSVDGLIVASSLTLLTEARAQRSAPGMARAGLVLGVVATVLANLAYGARYGAVGAVISAWPALAFIVSTEILLTQMRRAGGIPTGDSVSGGVPMGVPGTVPVAVPGDGVPPAPVPLPRTVAASRAHGRRAQAPERVFAAELAAGELPSLRQIKTKLHVGTDRARVIRGGFAVVLKERIPEAA